MFINTAKFCWAERFRRIRRDIFMEQLFQIDEFWDLNWVLLERRMGLRSGKRLRYWLHLRRPISPECIQQMGWRSWRVRYAIISLCSPRMFSEENNCHFGTDLFSRICWFGVRYLCCENAKVRKNTKTVWNCIIIFLLPVIVKEGFARAARAVAADCAMKATSWFSTRPGMRTYLHNAKFTRSRKIRISSRYKKSDILILF